jgi:hypothetical protein
MEKPLSAAKRLLIKPFKGATTDPDPTPLQMEEVDDL